ncbi:translation elongation factor 2 [Clavulina sp. PMI_390]|nr:translation elongation factor 2 [Clavulina sp. PMI_390]
MAASASTRCITVLGHVDHGKTTFVDSLLAANNIISARMAGKIRYMDSREDEQERGITMESSAISLRFKMMRRDPTSGGTAESYVVNLIDTPGHVDFLSEVSTASRLCDGALVMVDVVEGVCTQTIAVLRQAWADRLRPILIINKLDRLVTELKLSPLEAYTHLNQLLENVNAVMGAFYAGERMEDDLRWREERERRLAARAQADASRIDAEASGETPTDTLDQEEEFAERNDEDLYFAPERGNVVFASAIDGWAFRLGTFAQLYARKLGVNEANLRRALWGDFYLDPKTKRVISQRQLKGRTHLKPLFVQFVLDNIWAVYENVVVNPNPDKVNKIVTSLSLKILPRDLRSKDTRTTLQLIFSQWLSLSTCTFQAVVEIVPPPFTAQRVRVPTMIYPDLTERDGTKVQPRNSLEEDIYDCREGESARVVAIVSKMFAVPRGRLPRKEEKKFELKPRPRVKSPPPTVDETTASVASLTVGSETPAKSEEASETAEDEGNPDEEILLGFARLYAGSLTLSSSELYVLLPKYNTSLPRTHPKNKPFVAGPIPIKALYEMMGRDLVRVDAVQAGNVFAVEGLEGYVGRSATLCSAPVGVTDVEKEDWVNLAAVSSGVSPIVRVALEPKEPANMPQLIRGLRLLSQSDPCAETFQQKTGEWVILTAGELHLERCLKDLRERFAQVEIQASQPIVPFRETAIKAPEMLPVKSPLGQRGLYKGSSHNIVTFTIRARPLPESVTTFLQRNVSVIKRLQRDLTHSSSSSSSDEVEDEARDGDAHRDELVQQPTVTVDEFWGALEKLFDEETAPEWKGKGASMVDRIRAFGPNGVGPNILFGREDARGKENPLRNRTSKRGNPSGGEGSADDLPPEFETNIESGFQIATFQGPLCAEPMEGLSFFVESIEFDAAQLGDENRASKMAQVSGSLITASKEACRSGFLDWSPRLKMAIYSCDIQASTDVLGKVYGVIARRRGRIVSEEMKEGTSFFSIHAVLPVVESFGFADDIRKRSSGAASPQLIFSGYEILDKDPYWVPTTEEELEDLGEKADRANVARIYMDNVRRRKGMFVEQKVVEAAEKQRTLKR